VTEIVGVDIVINSEGARKGSAEYDAALKNVVESSRQANEEFATLDDILAAVRGTLAGAKTTTDQYATSSQDAQQAADALSGGVDLLARSVGRANPALAGKIALLRSLMAGGPVILGVTIGVTAVAAVMNRVREEAKKAEEETRKVIAAFTELARTPSASDEVVRGVQTLQTELARIDEAIAQWERTASLGSGPLGIGGAAGAVTEDLKRIYDERARLIEAAAQEISRIETGALRSQQQREASALASLIASNQATEQELARAARIQTAARASLSILEGDGSPEATAQRATLLGIIERITGAYEAQNAAAVKAQGELSKAAATAAQAALAAARAEADRLDALVELVKLRAEESGELAEIADRLARIDELQARGVADARTRLDLLREETRLRDALVGRIGTPTGGVVGGPGLAGGLFGPVTANNAGIEEAREALARLGTQAQDTAASTDSLSDTLLAGVEGVAALDRAVGFLPASLRGVASGVADVVRGLQTSQSEAASTAQRIAGGAGIIGGIVSIGIGLLRASDEAKEQANRAREQLAASIRDFVSPLKGFQTDIQQAAEALDKLAGGTAFRANYARTLGSATEALDFLAREAARLGTTRAGEVVQALADRLNAARDAFAGELELRRVAAEFGDEAAAQLRRQIELERALAEARRLGIDEAVVQEAFAAEARRRAREEQARAEEEYARAQREAARAAEEAARAQEEAARIAAEVAQRIADGNQALTEEIALRGLLLDGKDEEADLLRQEIRFRQELNRAIEAGLDKTLIDQLREIQRREREQLQDQGAVEELIRSVGGAGRAARVDLGGVTQAEVFRTNDILFSSLSVLQEIAANTRAMVRGGVVNRVAEFGDQSPNIDQALGSQARTTSYQQGRVRL